MATAPSNDQILAALQAALDGIKQAEEALATATLSAQAAIGAAQIVTNALAQAQLPLQALKSDLGG